MRDFCTTNLVYFKNLVPFNQIIIKELREIQVSNIQLSFLRSPEAFTGS
jgi:hypothetical protein